MLVRKKTHEKLQTQHTRLQLQYDALKSVNELATVTHAELVRERNDAGTLLLDCLSLLNSITISRRQNSLIVERETLVERAKELGWLPGREVEQEEVAQP